MHMSEQTGPFEGDDVFEDSTDPRGASVFDEPGVQAGAEQFAHQIAQRAEQHFADRNDPYLREQEQQAHDAEHERGSKAAMLVEQYPELATEPVARSVIFDARRVAAEIGDLALADDPEFWREVHRARLDGARGADVGIAIARQRMRDEIISPSGRLGASCLPF
jgi:hypothetical protein